MTLDYQQGWDDASEGRVYAYGLSWDYHDGYNDYFRSLTGE